MKLKILILSLSSAALVCGCALLGPKYYKPQVETPEAWHTTESASFTTGSVNLSDITWWRRFNDLTLNQLIEDALINNNNIQMAIGNITAAQGNLEKINMGWFPVIQVGGSASTGQLMNFSANSSNPLINSSSVGTSSFRSYSGGLVPVYSINIFQQYKQAQSAKAKLAQAEYFKDSVRLAVISQVAGSYFTLLALEEQLHKQKDLIADVEDLFKLTKMQQEFGVASLTDVQKIEEQLQQVKLQIPSTENNIIHTQNALQVLLNKNPGTIKHQNTLANINLNEIIPVNLPSEVLKNRPDIMQAEEELKEANDNIGVATSSFFPNIVLTSALGSFSTQLNSLFNPSGDFWSTQITALMPILNLSLWGQIKSTKGQYYRSYYNYIQTVRNAFSEVENDLSSIDHIKQTYKEANKLYEITQSNYNLNNTNYVAGYISYPETLASKLAMVNASINLTQIKLQQLQSIVNLYQAMAGGYNYKNTNEAKKFGDRHDA